VTAAKSPCETRTTCNTPNNSCNRASSACNPTRGTYYNNYDDYSQTRAANANQRSRTATVDASRTN
jgi:hypothetical protein